MEMISDLPIVETRSTTRYNDISTVYADLIEPDIHPNGSPKTVEYFSCFSNHYPVNHEREFIEKLIQENPGKYKGFRIGWSDAN